MDTSSSPGEVLARASAFAAKHNVQLERPLGRGKDGTVYSTSRPSAIKVHAYSGSYQRELACYLRLREQSITEIRGHALPRLLAYDDELQVIEMGIVTAPFVLDFSDAHLDAAPEFPEEVIQQWHEEGIERFGADRWERVQLVIATLRGQCGVILQDVNPGNITFGEGAL